MAYTIRFYGGPLDGRVVDDVFNPLRCHSLMIRDIGSFRDPKEPFTLDATPYDHKYILSEFPHPLPDGTDPDDGELVYEASPPATGFLGK